MTLTIKDIAQLANVSISSVSLALNNKPGISPKTRERILKIVQDQGYIHKSSSQDYIGPQPKKKIVNFVACTNPGIVIEQFETLPFFTELIRHIGSDLSSKGYSLMLSTINLDHLYEEIKQFSKANEGNGIILLGTDLTKEQIAYIAKHLPNIVVLDTTFDMLSVDFVNMNSFLGAYQAANHFIKLGHTRIGYVQSTVRIRNFEVRKEGFLTALKEKNLDVAKNDYFNMFPTVLTSQEQFKNEIVKRRHDLPTALFCESDYIAISLVKSLTELGVKIPEEVSIIGFDDIQEAKIISPELTSIHVPKERIASLAVDRIIELMNDPSSKKVKISVDTEVVERNSCREIKK
ncbi:LacI family DNA-binding transcriptional regulator [Bacillus sp. FJAT-50079]|uniref:LacI family DNA-binding transcriptional regulator n=1 Tax=Bacillus sp. FJAT-50079 TaxID=2833577 RepID=UPI001BC9052A|nr:LacI family DNA-binding transcriptional regulator [Bacillus sp. FJAT-50079]MBS4208110.1 LacI family DNA-binding transcriptional regulator [Bacillus sp. FJAT-50079]